MKQHPTESNRILLPLFEYERALEQAGKHHMQVDGKGYPPGKPKPKELCLIVAVADAVDAMFSRRPYRDGMPKEKVIGILERNEGPQWDADVVRHCLALINADRIPRRDL